jgi:hypothetical protein
MVLYSGKHFACGMQRHFPDLDSDANGNPLAYRYTDRYTNRPAYGNAPETNRDARKHNAARHCLCLEQNASCAQYEI